MTRTLRIEVPEWALPLEQEGLRLLGAVGGRASGKTRYWASRMIRDHVRDPNRFSVCVREFLKTLNESSKKTLEEEIIRLDVSDYFDVKDAEIRSKRGRGKIIFVGMRNSSADGIKSLEGYDCAWVDEAQNLSLKSLEVLEPTIRKPGSSLWFSWNPTNPDDAIEALLRGPELPPGACVVQANWTDNPWFPEVLRPRMEQMRMREPARFAHVYGGEFEKFADALVFPPSCWQVDDTIAPGTSTHLRFGADFGFNPDPSCLVRCWIDNRDLFIDWEAYGTQIETIDLPELFGTVPDAAKWPIVADSARPETISHLRKHGFPKIISATKGPKSLEEGVQYVRGFNIRVHPRCVNVIDELKHYRRKVDENGAVLPIFEDKDNHVIDALRYAVEGARRFTDQQIKAEPAPKVASFWGQR